MWWFRWSSGEFTRCPNIRYLLRDIVVDLTYSKYPKWGTIDQALAREGWKLVSLLRLSPIMPYNVLNYILSITGIGFVPFTVASAISESPALSPIALHTRSRILVHLLPPSSPWVEGQASITFIGCQVC